MFLPIFLANAILFTWAFGSRILPDIAIILLTATALVPLAGKLLLRKPPFSQSFSMAQQSDGWYVFAALPVLAMLWGVHVFFRSASGAYGSMVRY
ncbi:hypothetical protein Q0F98_14830 [Paenibacillus amylolyticus]|nr:hypothetical protein Q0F98_14830 [Paenibacillus amylolyticus]